MSKYAISFRFWDKETRKMIYPSIEEDWEPFRACILMVGIEDEKNGKKIYEGDIIEYDGIRYIVKFGEGMESDIGWVARFIGFYLKPIEEEKAFSDLFFERSLIDDWGDFRGKIIGNIYENPELGG